MNQQGETLLNLPIDNVQANPLQPRGSITKESISELVDSIREHGILEPLVVAHTPAGYQIIAGERRWRAAKLAGLEVVPAIVKKTTPKGMLEMALVENVQRTDLNPIDRANAFQRLITEFGYDHNSIAKKISKSPPYVSNTLKMLRLPDALTDGLLSGAITEGHARALASIEDPNAMIAAYKQILAKSGSVRMAEELARNYKSQQLTPEQQKNPAQPKKLIVTDQIRQIQDELREVMGKFSKVDVKQTTREAKIFITFKGSPQQTDKKVEAIYQALKDLNIKDLF